MDINSSYVNAYDVGAIQHNPLEKTNTSSAIKNENDTSSNLEVVDSISIEKSSLSQAVENINSGIAMSTIAQKALFSQQNILENIQSDLSSGINESNQDTIKEKINNSLEEFNIIASNTTYNGSTLLKTDGTTNDDISIVDDKSIIPIEKADTTSILETLKPFISDLTTNSDSMENMFNALNQGIDQLASFQNNFEDARTAMQSSVQNTLSTEKEIANSQSTVMDIDYSKEVSSFSKTNLISQMGNMMQTQANAIQGKNIALLSH